MKSLKGLTTFFYLDFPWTPEKIFSFSVLFLAAAIPFPLQFTNIAIGLLIISFIAGQKRTSQSTAEKWALVICLAYFLIHVVSLLVSDDFLTQFFQIEKRFTFLIFPLIFYFKKPTEQRLLDRALSVFVYAMVFASALCLVLSLFDTLVANNADQSYFSYESLTRQIGLHPSYMAMYIVFTIAIILNRPDRQWWVLIFLLIMLILISSRISFPCLMVVFVLQIIRGRAVQRRQALALVVGFMLIFGLSILISPSSFQRQIVDYFSLSQPADYTGINMRMIHWRASADIISNSFWAGYGVGEAQQVLDQAYIALGYSNFTGLSAHSQYLWEMICFGLGGLVMLCTSFVVSFFATPKYCRMLAGSFFLIVAIFCLTECVLYVNKGIIFFTFFQSAFLFLSNREQ